MKTNVELFLDLDAVADDAAGALDADVQASLYDALDWFRLTNAHVPAPTPLVVARARLGDAAAWLFLREEKAGRGVPLGSWYTLRYAPIFAGASSMADRATLIVELARALKKRFVRISLEPLDQAVLQSVSQGFSRAGWLHRAQERTANWIAHTAGEDFEAYWARRPGQLRSTVRRKSAKAKLDIRLHDDFDEAAWSDYEAVFAASWKGQEGSPAFLRALAKATAAWGRMRMGVAYDPGGAPLAAQFWTVDAGIATIHKLAYVDAAKALSPGSILSRAMFAHVIDRDRPTMIDFGTGDDPYKAEWMDERRQLHRFHAYDPLTVDGLAGYARARAAELVARRRSA